MFRAQSAYHQEVNEANCTYHRLHVQFIPLDDGSVRPETCRGRRIADIVRRRKTVYQVGNKEK